MNDVRLVESEVGFDGMSGKKQFPVAIQDHEEPVQGLEEIHKVKISGLYYKHIMIVNDAYRVVSDTDKHTSLLLCNKRHVDTTRSGF